MDLMNLLISGQRADPGTTPDQRQHQKADWEKALKVSESRIEATPARTPTPYGDEASRVARAEAAETGDEGGSRSAGRRVAGATAEQAIRLSAARPSTSQQASRVTTAANPISASGVVARSASVSNMQVVSSVLRTPVHLPMPLDMEQVRHKLSVLRNEKVELVVRDYLDADAPLYAQGAWRLRELLGDLGVDVDTIVLNGIPIYRKEKGHAG